MRLRDLLHDGEPHAGAGNLTSVRSAIEALENVCPLRARGWRRPELRTVMSTDPLPIAATSIVEVRGEYFTALSSNWRSARPSRWLIGIHEQIGRHPVDERAAVQAGVQIAKGSGHESRQRLALAAKRELAGVDAEHLHRVVHERVQAVEVFVDDRHELVVAAGRASSAGRWPRPCSTSAAS